MSNPVHYVKFMRGSLGAWNTLLTTPEKISDDTLYFIYENVDKTEGSLYLGQKLISGSHNGGSNVINIADLADITIGDRETLQDKQILVYNDSTRQWENASLSTIINTAVGEFVGATDNAPGVMGLVPVPQVGDQNKFLKGDGTWTPINIPTINRFNLEINNSNVLSLLDYDTAEIGSMPIKTVAGLQWVTITPGSLSRQITTLEKLTNQLNGVDAEPLDYNTIYMVENGNDSTSSDRYNEYMIINGKVELLGTFGRVELTNYVEKTTFNTTVSSLTNRISVLENSNFITQSQIGDLSLLNLSDGSENLIDEVNLINERLQWQELNET